MGHPSKTAKYGNLPSDDAVTRGINQDIGPYPAAKDIYCKQCGFPCNSARDAKNVDEFAGETISNGITVSDHGYPSRAEINAGDTYEGSERTTTTLTEELSNGSFEDWTAGSPDHWTVSGTTIEQCTTSGYFDDSDNGVSSAKITRASSDFYVSQNAVTPSDFNSNTVIFRTRVKSLTNRVIRLKISINSVDYYSTYNAAQQNFQELSVSVICPAAVSSLTVYMLADNADGTAYVDQCILRRSGNMITTAVRAGCPMCGSYDYA